MRLQLGLGDMDQKLYVIVFNWLSYMEMFFHLPSTGFTNKEPKFTNMNME